MIFDSFFAHREDIKKVFGEPLEWERLDNKRASRIRKTLQNSGWKDPDRWESIIELTVEAMIRFEKALRQHI